MWNNQDKTKKFINVAHNDLKETQEWQTDIKK